MDDPLVLNGLNGATGRYLLPEIPESTVARVARFDAADPGDIAPGGSAPGPLLLAAARAAGELDEFDPANVAEAGWAVVFADDAAPSVRDALAPLLDHRRAQATAVTDRYREFSGPDGHKAGETAARFLRRHGVDPGAAPDPATMPFYVLIVGDPQRVPYRFQYLLDVERAVGRLHFDTDDEYARYARSVVEAEGEARAGPSTAAFFAARNADDVATRLSADLLVGPLANAMAARFPEWTVETAIAGEATKARLSGLVGGAGRPAFLFTAGHGLFFDPDHPDQLRRQGALVCQDWPGPVEFADRPIPPEFVYGADDVADDADVRGMVAFLFACFGAGTPRTDDFLAQATLALAPVPIAPQAFVGRLPRRLLAHPAGGALAVIGHVDRAWPSSFNFPGTGVNTEAFAKAVAAIMGRRPVGVAMAALNERHARLTQVLVNEREAVAAGKATMDPALLATVYKARNDARNYAVCGDPAVRLG